MNKFDLQEKILSNTASEEEFKQFKQWLNESRENKEEFNRFKQAWEKMDDAFSTKRFNTLAAKYKVREQVATVIVTQKQKRLLRVKRMAFAATFALLVGLGFLIYTQTFHTGSHQVYIAGNTVNEITLSDNTHVWLNAHSTLETAKKFGQKQRKVILKGEAFFDVERDESKPFEIKLANTQTRVLGTSFNLYHDSISNEVKLTVASGIVEFSHDTLHSTPVRVTKNESAIYSGKDHKVVVSRKTNPNYLSWKTGKLVFDDTPIEQVCSDLSKFYGEKVESTLDDQTILTGTFDNDSFKEVLAAIQLSLNIQVVESNGTYQLQNKPLKSTP